MTAVTTKKVITCSFQVKDSQLQVVACPGKLKGELKLCTNRANHINNHKSGFCNLGFCEGLAPKSFRGKPQKTCPMWKTCPCSCHTVFDYMFRESGMSRIAVDNSGYVPDHGGFVMPTPEERIADAVSSVPTGTTAPVVIKSQAPDIVPATVARRFTETPTGRAARGELEAWVEKQVHVWLIDQAKEFCTPGYLAREISQTEGVKEPSVGAIDAVFRRWVQVGFAVIERKPTRFIKFTEDGLKYGLAVLKERDKRNKRSVKRKMERGIR